jgi:antitoxin (DNA-binding transcriptional repressor) of toxin-antitoxin stability system
MRVVNMRELARSTSRVVDSVHRSGKATLVTRGGRPVVALIPIDRGALEDWILAHSPGIAASLRAADADLRAGRAMSLDAFLAGNPTTARRWRTR